MAINLSVRSRLRASTMLLVSKEPASFQGLRSVGQVYAWQVETASCGLEALERMESGLSPDVVVLDVAPGDSESLHTLRRLRRVRPNLPVVLLSGPEESRPLMEAADVRPDDCLLKPWGADDLESVLRRHMTRADSNKELAMRSTSEIEVLGEDFFYVAASPLMRVLRSRAEMLAQVDVPVLIVGEAGSGRETTARLIHGLSVRSPFPFLKSNCEALPADLLSRELLGYEVASLRGGSEVRQGKFELGNNGSLLLQELDTVAQGLLAKLLPVAQKGRFVRMGGDAEVRTDVRLLATLTLHPQESGLTPRLANLREFTKYIVEVPPLRERAEDIPLLVGNFMTRLARRYGLPVRQISSRVLDSCQRHSWPGNLRELESFVKRYLIMGDDTLGRADALPIRSLAEHFPFDGLEPVLGAPKAASAGETSLKSLVRSAKGEAEKNAIIRALEKTRWNRKAAARDLGISYRALLYKIQEYHMSPPDPSIVVIHERAKVEQES